MHSEVFPPLYAKTKTGAIKAWSIRIEETSDSVARITISHGQLNGKFTEASETISCGKNIGKANETSSYKQAELEALSKWKKKMDSGYGIAIPADDQVHNTNALGLLQPMLAVPLDKIKKALPEEIFIQPKMNGHRALLGYVDNKIVMWSRRGKWITAMDHILEALDGILPTDMVLDGELYIHGSELQELGSLIKKKQPGSIRVEYHVYDLIRIGHPEITFSDRLKLLKEILLKEPAKVTLVETQTCGPEQVQEYFQYFTGGGYEGAMIRLPTQTYEPGFRSRSLIKVKAFADAEWKVKDITRGIPKVVEGKSYDIAILDCDTFRVTAPGSVIEKDHVWQNREQYIGRLITVQYAYLTNDGIPFHPVALQWRDDI